MDNLKNLNFTELNPSEMKLVNGGNWLDTLRQLLDALDGNVEALAAYVGMSVEELRSLLGL
ncbi:hypothetical protein [Flavobacterium johnsoniae]|jgi:hypothetical protein|uniref:hypothetical protein n=1 Tax=Flavobacterium TaxID=237 RepID=UPI0005C5A690|nr:hypothetical protein [Flavobacterium johnsoniae]OXE97979.1 hypothetical protein B0A63_17790 [Flavobacterium johnsoniae UW101]WQG83545.1 hypothetical protein SR927_10595 [Flavobacterium johnsoniae UW101]SHK29621.1 hypothetical protein SAMN05444146_1063 [Flavobacterium johnsoniae]